MKLTRLFATINTTVQNEDEGNVQKLTTLQRMISDLYAKTSPKIVQTSSEAGELLAAMSRESAERGNAPERYALRTGN